RDLHRGFLEEQYEDLLRAALPADGLPRPVDLALFRRRQILRIVLRDVLKFADLSETAEDLSNLADAMLNVTLRAVRRDVARTHGEIGNQLSVIALGKLGGLELNYSSDIDLMFVYSGENDHEQLTAKEFFKLVANRTTEMLSTYTPEGMCYRVDLRLRPDGRLGEVVQSLEGARRYYETRGRDWELQMLIKARVAAGDKAPGRELLAFVEPLIYKTTTDFHTVEAVSETRARIHEKQARLSRQNTVDVKLAKGGIRDIEFLVQCLQRLHGGREPWVRHGGTLLALSRLRDKELLSNAEYSRLASAYQFLRHLEHRLQFAEDRQTHSLPRQTEQLDLLARKMPGLPGDPRASTLQRELDRHFASVQDLYDRVIHLQLPMFYSDPYTETGGPAEEPPVTETPARGEFPSINLSRYLEVRAPLLSRFIAGARLVRSQESMESFLEKVVARPPLLLMLEDSLRKGEELVACAVDVFEHSQYFADQLVRHPELLTEVREAVGARQGRRGFVAPRDLIRLRLFFREQMVRIQSDSVYHRVPVFKTLKRTSDLAESIIAAAYEVALQEPGVPPSNPGYVPVNQMMVIALGRLGMREFDLASDADLNFVIPDADAPEVQFWTGVAERLINVVSAYTGDGVVFTIDTRLRPNGQAGALVQTEAAYREYFESRAEAWEGISYMKARAVAGNVERGTAFLNELQQVDWRRYGQGGRSRTDLAHMRLRLEREQGARNPLKAGPGGYYDIDFVLMYLRLRGAASFYKVLNTPARIEVIAEMGDLAKEDVAFLNHAATFFRAVDHGMRISTGHADGRLPTNPAQVAILTELVQRWTPPGFLETGAGALGRTARRIRRETRAFFQRVFGAA
ncbi:MAG: [glutamine synthetase] adenylyltransferase / [glutamine synthetase]-adenylyl-L-tyrosine, partial [Bryobacterales bacterium]|nr:[glutamine synthetase] adenylyltransferase / [glutamine synthetase]-adenylyl-L-tyrosine [Bryobacterales bacterium]